MLSRIMRILVLAVLFAAFNRIAVCEEFYSERKLYLQGIEALNKDRYKEYRLILSRLKSYPLYPYLLEAGLRDQIENIDKHVQNTGFLEKYRGLPVVSRLRSKWVSYLDKNKKWEEISQLYVPSGRTSQRCIYQKSLYYVGKNESAFDGVESLWTSRRTIPEACQFLIDQWVMDGNLTNDLIWKRIFLLLPYSRNGETKRLAELLSEDERILSYLLHTIHKHPESVLELHKFDIDSKYYGKVLLHGIRRLASQDLALALDVWSEIQHKHNISDAEYKNIELYIVRKMAYQRHPSAFSRFSKIDEKILSLKDKGIMLRLAIRSQSWQEILQAIDKYNDAEQLSDRLKYWRARAYAETNRANQAQIIFKGLANKQGYYGFLSADILSLDYTIGGPDKYTVDIESLTTLEARPDIQRARELFKVGQIADARREWRYGSRNYSDKQLIQAAHLSQRWGWYDRAIFAMARTPYKDALELRFPLVHQEYIHTSAERNDIEPAWVFALIRQESAFISDARSSSGAMGLMQLMPGTANQVARKLKIKRLKRDQIIDVKTNIILGSNYLSGRYRYFNEHKVLATAAYNAGPNRVKKWLPEEGSIPADIWIDSIPYNETRNYVKNILAYLVIYEKRLGLTPNRISQRMPDIVSRDMYQNKARAENI